MFLGVFRYTQIKKYLARPRKGGHWPLFAGMMHHGQGSFRTLIRARTLRLMQSRVLLDSDMTRQNSEKQMKCLL